MEHGGDIISYKNYYDGDIIDFSSNINPLGPPKGLYEELISNLNRLASYPDIKYRDLKYSIKEYLGCPIENVIVGNGAMEVINNLISIFPRVAVVLPSFSEYEKRALAYNKPIIRLKYNQDFTLNLNIIRKNLKARDLLILGNPNNPTGIRIPKEMLINLYGIIKDKNAYLLLDEAFYEFCPMDYDTVKIFNDKDFANIGIIRAATKFFGLPGIRLGYGCVPRDLMKKYEKMELPWSVNALADIAGRYIFQSKDYIEESRAYINRERQFLLDSLGSIHGIQTFHTHTNYILIKLLDWTEEYVFNFFLKRGLLIRKCSSFNGLDDKYIRVAIKDRKNNEKLIKTFIELGDYI